MTISPNPSTLEITESSNPKLELKTIGYYSQMLRAQLPAEYFEPQAIRLLWFVGYIVVAAASLGIIVALEPIWPIKLILAMTAGLCFGCSGFFAHEVLHGSVVKGKNLQDTLAFFGFMPFFISPTFWRLWHNQLHHGKTQAIISDPDAYPTLKIFRHSKFMNFMFPFTPGSGHLRSYTYFFFWFSFHVFVAQIYLRFRNSLFERLDHRRVTIEFAAQILIWMRVLTALGPTHLVWTFIIPFLTQNYFVMSYIATNHNLSPLTKINDPLANSLTVTNVPAFEWIHLNFGYHVEHHIFPNMSGIYTKKVHEVLKREFPDRFLCMPKWIEMKKLYQTARIYKTMTTLTNPETGAVYQTLGTKPVVTDPTNT